jgi:hypothetical protein
MINRSKMPSLVSGAMLLLFSGVSAAQQCSTGEQPLEFRFFTDDNSWKDNGWVLECDYEDEKRELVWSVPIGSLELQDRTEVIREAACVPDTATCYLNIFDAKGDGLQGSKNGDPSTNTFAGWFAFLHGATTVATYKNLEEPKFSELSYCVGPKCDQKPQEIQTDDEDCQDMVYLAMQLDNNPQDTSYQLVCGEDNDRVFDKKVIWDGKGFTKAGAFIEEETCLPKDACCEFIVVDGNSNGLTETVDVASSASGTQPRGFIYLENNYEPVLEYDGNTGETFGVLTKRFACAADKTSINNQDEEEDKEIIATEAVNVPDDEDIEGDEESADNKEEGQGQGQGQISENLEEVFGDITDGDNLEEVFGDYIDSSGGIFDVYTDAEDYGTSPPTSEDWVSDDDYQNVNDGLTDDVFKTEQPTIWSSTWAPTSSSTERDAWDIFDDVVDVDDTAWVQMDDQVDGMSEIDGMIQDLTDNSPKLPSDSQAALLLNGQPVYTDRKVGLNRNAKITIGVLVPLFFLWTFGLMAYYFREKLCGTSNDNDDDAALEKENGTTGDAVSDESLSVASVFDNIELDDDKV